MSALKPNSINVNPDTQSFVITELNKYKKSFDDILLLLTSCCNKHFASITIIDSKGKSICFTKGSLNKPNVHQSGSGNTATQAVSAWNTAGMPSAGFQYSFDVKLSAPLANAIVVIADEYTAELTDEQQQCINIIQLQITGLAQKAVSGLVNSPAEANDTAIVKQKKAPLLAHGSELSDYKHALDESAIVAITDQKGKIKYVNDKFCSISKYSREELIGQDHRIIKSGFHSKEFIRNIWTTIASGNIWKGEIKNRAKDGSYYWVETSIIPFLDVHGKPYQYLAIRSDITQAKIAEDKINALNETLSRNEQKFRALIENSNDIISLLDADYKTVFQSASATRITGWTLEDLQNISRLDHVHPEDRKLVEQVMADSAKMPGEPYPIRYRKLHKNGYYIWLEGSMTNFLNNPSLSGIIINLRDVTARITSEALLMDKSKEISEILDRIQDGFITLDKNDTYTYVNKRIGEMTGFDPQYLLGKRVWDVFPDAVGSATYQTFLKARQQQGYCTNTDYYPNLELWQENHIYPSGDGLAIFIKDISHQKQSEEELMQLNGRLSFHLTNSPLASMEFDNQFVLKRWSPQAEKMFGWTSEEAIGKHFQDLNMVHEDEVARTLPITNQLLSGCIDRYHMTSRNKAKDGSVINCEWYVSVFKDAAGKPLSILSLAQNITERVQVEEALRNSEEKYRALIEEAIDGIIVYNPVENRFTNANKRMSELLEKPNEQVLQTAPAELFEADDFVLKDLIQPSANHPFERKIEKHLTRLNGEDIYLEISVKQMPDSNLLAFVRDVTERKKHEDAIRHLNEGLETMVAERTIQLETANKDLEAFSYSVSHDLRAPLRAVNGYASILEEDYGKLLDAEGKRLLKEVQQNAIRMGSLIDDLLTFSRLGRKAVNTTLINMNGLSSTAFDEVQDSAKAKVQFKLNPLHNAMADYSLIKQVMINLLSNAVKYSSKNQVPVVEVSSTLNANEVIYAVKDNGVGFDMKYQNKLFGVFQRLHSNDEFEGTGVGLATVQRVIKKHGGNVWAEGKEGRGAIFYFSLPIN